MFMELYYQHYKDNCNANYWEMEEKSIPYAVRIPEKSERAAFGRMLAKDGFICINSVNQYLVLYVNFNLMRWGSAEKACASSCIDSRLYTKEEFMNEIYNPWKKKNNLKIL